VGSHGDRGTNLSSKIAPTSSTGAEAAGGRGINGIAKFIHGFRRPDLSLAHRRRSTRARKIKILPRRPWDFPTRPAAVRADSRINLAISDKQGPDREAQTKSALRFEKKRRIESIRKLVEARLAQGKLADDLRQHAATSPTGTSIAS